MGGVNIIVIGLQTILKFQSVGGATNIVQRIFSSLTLVVFITVFVKLAVVPRELVIAGYFGTSELVDAYLIALLLPMFAINVLAGSFSSALIPVYVRVRDSDNTQSSMQLFASSLTLGILLLLAASIVLLFLMPVFLPVLGSGFTPQNLLRTEALFYWLLPTLFFSGTSRLLVSALNAGERFALPAFAPILTPICAVIGALIFFDRWGIYGLAGGTLFGSGLELVVVAVLAAKHQIPIIPKWYGMTDELKCVINQLTPMIAGSLLMSGTLLVDQAMAAMLEPGSVATLNYANRIVALLLGLGVIPLGTVVLPYFSRLVASGNWRDLQQTFRILASGVLIISVPLTIGLIVFSNQIVAVIFERGAFLARDTELVGQVQAFYLIQIPFHVAGILGARLLSALSNNQILMKISFMNLLANIVGNYILIKYFGLAGIALSTSLVFMSSFAMIYFSLLRAGVLRGGYSDKQI